MSELMEKAKDVGRELRNTAEYRQLKLAEQGLQQDPAAQQLIQEAQQVQQKIEQAQKLGAGPSQEQIASFEESKKKMNGNVAVSSFMKAQQEFQKVAQSVNEAITEGLRED